MSISRTYPWLWYEADGTIDMSMDGCTGAEQDRRLIIVQEIQEGRLVLPEQVIAEAKGDDDPSGHDLIVRCGAVLLERAGVMGG